MEVLRDGRWGTVCADDWDLEEARVVCRQLNLGFARSAVKESYFGNTNLPTLLSGVDCRHDEISLYHCLHHQNVSCSSPLKTAAVICVRGKKRRGEETRLEQTRLEQSRVE